MARDPDVKFAFDPAEPPVRVRRWLARFQKLLDTQPKDVWVYVASGSPLVMAKDSEGGRVFDGTTFDQDAIVGDLNAVGEWDGGDF